MKSYIKGEGRREKGKVININIIGIFILFLFFFTFLPFPFPLSPVYAQSLSLSISPPLFEVMMKPGKSVTQAFKLTNESDNPTVIMVDIRQLSEQGVVFDPQFTPEPWIKLLNTDIFFHTPFLLSAKQTKQIIVAIQPPKDAKEEDYYRALVVSTIPETPLDSTQSQFTAGLAMPLLVTVTKTGEVVKKGLIVRFDAPAIMDSFDTLKADIVIQNAGNIYFRPNGTITLSSPIGIGTYQILPSVILAGQLQKLAISGHEEGNGPTLELPGLFLGKYTINVDFTLDEGTIHVTGKKSFYAIPYKATIVIIVLALIIFLRSRKKKNKIK